MFGARFLFKVRRLHSCPFVDKNAETGKNADKSRYMELKHLTIGLRPELYQYLEECAEHAGVSTDRYAAMSLEWMRAKDTGGVEEGEEEVEPYPVEELYREIDEARKDLKNGKLKVYHSADEMFKSLGI